MENVTAHYQTLIGEWKKPQPNLKKCGTLLEQLKIGLVNLSYLPIGNTKTSGNELKLARDVLEIGAEFSVANHDITAFERYMAQLKCYYYDYKSQIGESKNMYKLLGLNLLFLLSQNRVAEFHTELELLPIDTIRTNPFISHPLALEQFIMEGRYNKIFAAKGNSPTDSYNFFIDILIETVRDEIAACLERAYDKISLQEAAKRLNLKTKEEIEQFGKKRNWKIGSPGFYHFFAASDGPVKAKENLPSVELATQAIFYARELEMIV